MENEFDIELMMEEITEAIEKFNQKHPNQLISAFGLDAGVCSFATSEDINKEINVPDWTYYLVELEEGFDFDAYEEHCEEEEEDSAYAVAMAQLIKKLDEKEVFKKLNTSDDFKTLLVMDHD